MEKIWLNEYQQGVPAEIDADHYASLTAVLENSVEKFADKPALQSFGVQLRYGELDVLSRDFAAYLQKDLRLIKGERIALMMPNLLQYPVVLFAAFRAGLTVVNVNPLYTPRELEHQLKDSGATSIVILENFAHTLAKVIDKTPVKNVIITRMGDLLGFRGPLLNFAVKYLKHMIPAYVLPQAIAFKNTLRKGKNLELKPVPLKGEDIAFLQYTGGTTGLSKGAVLTHRNMVANLEQASAWLKPIVDEGNEIIITALPMYHIFSLTLNGLCFAKIGALSVLVANPKDIPAFINLLKRQKFTFFVGVNTLFNALLTKPELADVDFSGVKTCLGGGMAVQRAVAEHWEKVTGISLIEGYGLTESSPIVSVYPLDRHQFNGTVGLPVPSTEISIRDEQGRELAQGERGEVCVRGPQVMRGYWNQPEETAKVLGKDGFLATGDIGYITDEGYIKLVDRKKDMILVSGFNVYPNEIEDVVALMPGVKEVACIGIPDEGCGEKPKLFVVKLDPSLTAEMIIKHCRTHLTNYKIPKTVEFREELPKTNVGKILRRALRDETVFDKTAS